MSVIHSVFFFFLFFSRYQSGMKGKILGERCVWLSANTRLRQFCPNNGGGSSKYTLHRLNCLTIKYSNTSNEPTDINRFFFLFVSADAGRILHLDPP